MSRGILSAAQPRRRHWRLRIQKHWISAWSVGWCSLGLLLLTTAVRGATTTSPFWITRAWQSDDGLPNNNVTSLAQTDDGYLWIANDSRLARFDGVRFESFPSGRIVPGYVGRITGLLASRDGSLWVAMDHGPAARLKAGSVKVFTNGLPDATVRYVVEEEGSVWIAYAGALCRIKDGASSRYTNSLLDNSTACFASDGKGQVWFASRRQIGILRDGTPRVLLTLRDANARVTGCRAGGVWICQGTQLSRADEHGQLVELGAFTADNPNTTISAMLEDHSGALWIGTRDSGLFRYNGTAFESIPTSHRLILSLLEDREGNIWAGTGGGGLDRIQPRAVMLEGRDAGLPIETVRSICEDARGVIWAVTETAILCCRTNDHWIIASNVWPQNDAQCVAADRAGNVWIAAGGRGLLRWRDGQLTTFGYADGLVSHTLHAVLATAAGDIWIGGGEPSLQRLRDGHFTNIKLPDGCGMIRMLAEDAAGNVWVAPSKRGLLRVEGETIIDETPKTSGSLSAIRALYATSDGSLWIGFAGSGLGRLQHGHFSKFTIDQGLYDYAVSQVVADDRGWLWLGADHGIFKVRLQDFDEVAAGRAAEVRSIHYGPSAGLESLQANFGRAPGVLQSHDGRLWMPMRSALAVADPNKLHEDAKPPLILLKQVKMDDKVLASYGGVLPVPARIDAQERHSDLRLPPSHHRLEFEFAALSFAAPENVQFRYRLEGFDGKWIDAQGQRTASYSQLPAGNYRFVASACNSDGVWNETGASLAFSVVPFVWQTWWFRLLVVAVFASVVFGVARYISVRHLRAKLAKVEYQAALDKSRMAGMAEVASSVLHNVGNALNSVNVSTSLLHEQIHNSRVNGLSKVVALLKDQANGLATLLAGHPNGARLPDYLDRLNEYWKDEQEDLLEQTRSLKQSVGEIEQIVKRQQAYAAAPEVSQSLDLITLVEDAIRINSPALDHEQVHLTREFGRTLPVTADRHKVLQILINLLSNSKHAFAGVPGERRMTVRVEKDEKERVKISITDNGKGIPGEDLTHIFRQDFHHKDRGLGLHSGAILAKELGGSLTVQSDGPGCGASFTLEIPTEPPRGPARN